MATSVQLLTSIKEAVSRLEHMAPASGIVGAQDDFEALLEEADDALWGAIDFVEETHLEAGQVL